MGASLLHNLVCVVSGECGGSGHRGEVVLVPAVDEEPLSQPLYEPLKLPN